MTLMTLTELGFNDFLESQLDAEQAAKHELARVIAVHKNSFIISNGTREVFAELSGNLIYSSDSALDLPTTGDWVYADFFDDATHAIIYGVVSRRSLLRRKTAGRSIDFQLIAANVDVAFIVQSANENFNLARLERYLVLVNESNITPVVLLSKSDLVTQQELETLKDEITQRTPNTQVLACSTVSGGNIDVLSNGMTPGWTYCLMGSSGVGKTTLLNQLLGQDALETQSVSRKQSKGRHTTTRRELVRLENGALIIDTPGMRELANLSVESGIDETFADITALARKCKYNNCSHSQEDGCAIQAAITAGQLTEARYANYVKVKSESSYHALSYLEKRQKDKDFGKMIKATLKHKKRK